MQYRKFLLLSNFLFLTACMSVGSQYKFPTETESFAELVKSVHGTVILSFDEKGCYTGQTHVAEGTRLRVGEEVVIEYNSPMRIGTYESVCRAAFGLTPLAGVKYGARFEHDARGRTVVVGTRCVGHMYRIEADGSEQIVSTRALRVNPLRPTCIRAVPSK